MRRCLLHPLVQAGNDLRSPIEPSPQAIDVGHRVEHRQVGKLRGQQRVGLEQPHEVLEIVHPLDLRT